MGKNRVRELREARQLTQVELAAAAGLSRQSVSAIESGRATPAVDVAMRLASALGGSVEDLFGAPAPERTLRTEPASQATSGRLAIAHVGGRWVAHALDRDDLRTSADAFAATGSRRGLEARLTRPSSECKDNLLVMGCAAALGLLADRLNSSPGAGHVVWLSRSSAESLAGLARNQVHIAGVHLVDSTTGEANLPDVRRAVRGRDVTLITLARWQVGLVVASGNPGRIRSTADLGRRGLRLVVREAGSGARRLLDRELRGAGLPRSVASNAAVRARGHLEVAHAVALGAATTGVASRDAAIAFGLDFVPLAEERYDLALPSASLGDARLQRLFDVVSSAGFRQELSSLAYDVRASGARVN